MRLKKTDLFWGGSLFLIYLLYWIPMVHFQPLLSTGDMGRDLYAFESVLHGYRPCRDYWWQYGPLMPLYYVFWFLVGGVNLLSVRIGLAVIYFLSALIIFKVLRLFISPGIAFLSALAFMVFDMTWTFNHIGAIPFLLLSIFCLWKFFLTHQTRWCYLGLFSVVAIAEIKISTGITSFFAFYASLLFYYWLLQARRSKCPLARKHFIYFPLLFFAIVLGTGLLMYWGISLDWIDQCLTISPHHRVWPSSHLTLLKHLILRFFVWEPSRLFGVGALWVLGVLSIFNLRKKKLTETENRVWPFVIGSLVFFTIANSMDYFAMDGKINRFDFWLYPMFLLWMGLLAGWASLNFAPKFKMILGSLIFLSLLWNPFRQVQQALALSKPERFLDFSRGQVYVGGPLSSVQTIKEGTRFIFENTKPTDTLLAVPYEPLYSFLSGRRHATRELIFVDDIKIGKEQEEKIYLE